MAVIQKANAPPASVTTNSIVIAGAKRDAAIPDVGMRESVSAARATPRNDGLEGLAHLCRRDLKRTRRRAAKAVGPIHVLHIGLRQRVLAWRHRPHDIGDGEHRLVLRRPVERRAEMIVAEFGMHRLGAVLDPLQRAGSPDDTRFGLSISKPAGR